MTDTFDFFSTPGKLTSPGAHAALFDPLPRDMKSLTQIIHGLMIHVFWIERYGITLP